MSDRYAKQFNFQYEHLIMARVTGVYTLADARKLLIDASALDGRGNWQKIPVSLPPGVTRNYRKGQIVGLLFRYSASNYPTAVAHIYNLESDVKYTDPLPPPFEYVDDHVLHHPETGAFLRFRSATSTPAAGGGDGQPGIVEVTLASGATLAITETDTTHAAAVLSLPSGASLAIAVDGTVTITSPVAVIFDAPNVEFGDNTDKGAGNALVRREDLDNVVQQFNAHVHTGVVPGHGISGPPETPAITPPCSANVFSE